MSDLGRTGVVLALGTTQTVAWASSYYLPAIVATPIADELGLEPTSVFAAFSLALLIAAAIGPKAGKTIDAIGGRKVLALSNLIIALGLITLASAHSTTLMWIGWAVLGVGMGLGLYDAAFASLGRLYGTSARGAITGITLIAGFASTIGWPLTAWGVDTIGWRSTCLAWAAGQILVALPLNCFALPAISAQPSDAPKQPVEPVHMDRNMWLLGFAFACTGTVTASLAVHLPGILIAAGMSTTQAVAAGALIGPAQVAARLAEASLFKNFHPLNSLRMAQCAHPLGVALFGLSGATWPGLMVILHGAGNGIMTIALGTVPLSIFGSRSYGARLGLLGVPMRIAQAFSPLLFGLLLAAMGAWVLGVTSLLMLMAFAAICLVRRPEAPPT